MLGGSSARLARFFAAMVAALSVATVLFAVAPAARAEVAAADPIDTAMRACLARADRSSTAGQIQCMDDARTAWRTAADTALTQLLAKLPAAQQKRWQLSQQKWVAWRDAEDTMLGAAFATTSGSTYQLYEADMRLQPVRERALALRNQAAMYNGDAPKVRACSADARCEHVSYDLNRYYRQLYARMSKHARPTVSRSQSDWRAYRDATTPLIDEHARLDLLGGRLATLKRLAETVNNH
ncbi:lysozyme inhibitor LprI family protein [Paraburkholderia sp. CNPSo 3076]|uniref:lysozyme inhibitor LprI family protein n=1 Tax=Paraburkholderia sp. CNPSo 3076 TaxID=2940936 RepID=UPI00224D8610|nr:lysozyme inhibitor LprI family protein [Paraburkholderia sp. CNPSo 3076]